MSFTVSGADGVLHLLAALCFLAAAVIAWARAGHRAVPALACGGLFLWVLATLVH